MRMLYLLVSRFVKLHEKNKIKYDLRKTSSTLHNFLGGIFSVGNQASLPSEECFRSIRYVSKITNQDLKMISYTRITRILLGAQNILRASNTDDTTMNTKIDNECFNEWKDHYKKKLE